MWVYNIESRKVVHLYLIEGSRDLYCEGRTSCLDMPLVWPSAMSTQCWEHHHQLPYPATQPWPADPGATQWKSLHRFYNSWRYSCNTVKEAVQVGISHHDDIRPVPEIGVARIDIQLAPKRRHTEAAFTLSHFRSGMSWTSAGGPWYP